MKFFLTTFISFCVLNLAAQDECNPSHILFNPPHGRQPQVIRSLGNNPQIQCLRGVTDKRKFLEAIKKCRNIEIYKADFKELDEILKEIGFLNGLDDVNLQNLNYETIPAGSKGMLGYKKNKKIGYVYAKLAVGVRGWKITSPTNCYTYIFTQCGNAFYPTQRRPQKECPPCPTPPCPTITLISDEYSQEVKCESQTAKQIYITTYIVFYRESTSQRQKGGGGYKGDSFTFYSDTLTLDKTICANSNHSFYLPALNIQQKICSDTTIKIPLSLKSKGASSVAVTGDEIVERTIRIQVSKKDFRRFKDISVILFDSKFKR